MAGERVELYAFCFPEFSEHDLAIISDLRRQHDREEASLLAPHFTLVYQLPGRLQKKLSEAVEYCANQTKPFSLELDTIGHEAGGAIDPNEYVFLCPGLGQPLVDLHNKLYAALPEAQEFLLKPFFPHVTLGKFDSPDDCKAVLAELNMAPRTVTCKIVTLSVTAWYGNAAEVLLEVPLRGQ